MQTPSTSPAHTPGPWEAAIDDTAFGRYTVLPAIVELTRIFEEGDEERTEYALAVDRANARLISAAPDLEDALFVAENTIRGVQIYETPGSSEHQQLDWVLSVIHAALAKAS